MGRSRERRTRPSPRGFEASFDVDGVRCSGQCSSRRFVGLPFLPVCLSLLTNRMYNPGRDRLALGSNSGSEGEGVMLTLRR